MKTNNNPANIKSPVRDTIRTSVPCTFSASGWHAVTVALADNGTVRHISCECGRSQDATLLDAAARMGEKGCAHTVAQFIEGLRTRRYTSDAPSGFRGDSAIAFAYKVAMGGVAHNCGAHGDRSLYRRGPHKESEPKSSPLAERSVRARWAHALTKELTREFGTTHHTPYPRSLFQVASLADGTLVLQAYGREECYRDIATRAPESREWVVNKERVRQVNSDLTCDGPRCHACEYDFATSNVSTRHRSNRKHRTNVAGMVRRALAVLARHGHATVRRV